MGKLEDSKKIASQDVEGFIDELIQCIAETQGNREQVYRFLQVNLVHI